MNNDDNKFNKRKKKHLRKGDTISYENQLKIVRLSNPTFNTGMIYVLFF